MKINKIKLDFDTVISKEDLKSRFGISDLLNRLPSQPTSYDFFINDKFEGHLTFNGISLIMDFDDFQKITD